MSISKRTLPCSAILSSLMLIQGGRTSPQDVVSTSQRLCAVSQCSDVDMRDAVPPVSSANPVTVDVSTIFPVARGIETIVIPQAPTFLTEGGSVVTSLSVPINTKTSVTSTATPTPTQFSTLSNETPVTPAISQTPSRAVSAAVGTSTPLTTQQVGAQALASQQPASTSQQTSALDSQAPTLSEIQSQSAVLQTTHVGGAAAVSSQTASIIAPATNNAAGGNAAGVSEVGVNTSAQVAPATSGIPTIASSRISQAATLPTLVSEPAVAGDMPSSTLSIDAAAMASILSTVAAQQMTQGPITASSQVASIVASIVGAQGLPGSGASVIKSAIDQQMSVDSSGVVILPTPARMTSASNAASISAVRASVVGATASPVGSGPDAATIGNDEASNVFGNLVPILASLYGASVSNLGATPTLTSVHSIGAASSAPASGLVTSTASTYEAAALQNLATEASVSTTVLPDATKGQFGKTSQLTTTLAGFSISMTSLQPSSNAVASHGTSGKVTLSTSHTGSSRTVISTASYSTPTTTTVQHGVVTSISVTPIPSHKSGASNLEIAFVGTRSMALMSVLVHFALTMIL